jgi:hypothetical protein
MFQLVVFVVIGTVLGGLLTALHALEGGKLEPIRRRPFHWLAGLPPFLGTWIFATGALLTFFTGTFVIGWASPYAGKFVTYLMRVMSLKWIQLATGPLVIMVGFVAYWFKTKNQTAYGAVEVFIAGSAAVVAAKQINPGAPIAPIVATLVAAVYVVSRGLGNYAEGRKKGRSATTL